MIQICRKDKNRVLNAIRKGHIDAADYLEDIRRDNSHIPFDTLMVLTIVAKLKLKTSLTDVPLAVTHAELLAELGWNIGDNERDINGGLFSEGVMRKLLARYSSQDWVDFYNHYVRDSLLETLRVQKNIHILDCTKIPVNLDNENYEESSVVKIEGKTFRGY